MKRLIRWLLRKKPERTEMDVVDWHPVLQQRKQAIKSLPPFMRDQFSGDR